MFHQDQKKVAEVTKTSMYAEDEVSKWVKWFTNRAKKIGVYDNHANTIYK
jgi:hypothetical protein